MVSFSGASIQAVTPFFQNCGRSFQQLERFRHQWQAKKKDRLHCADPVVVGFRANLEQEAWV
jgi:hypothetical protein